MFTEVRQAILPLALRRLHRKDDLERTCLLIESLAQHWRDRRAFDLLIVAVLRNTEKTALFSVPERVEMLREVTRQWSSVEVDVFDGLLVDYARKRHAGVILRGIRAISDYEYELQMALMNRKLEPRLETVFMLPGETYSYLSAKLVREIAQFGGPLDGLVPPLVQDRLRAKVS